MEKKIYFPAPIEGKDVDQTKAQVENVAEPIQGSPQPQSPEDSATSDEETTAAVSGEQVQTSTEATDGDTAVPTEGYEATTDTTESNDAVQGDENTSAEQDSQAQATTGAGPEEKKDGKKATKKTKNSKDKKYTLEYPDDVKAALKVITDVFNAEIERAINDPNFYATPFNGGKNAFVDITQGVRNGSYKVAGFAENRIHGRDEKTTGESLMTYQPQHPLIIMTRKMAEAAGLTPTLLPSDKSGSLTDKHVIIPFDGGGRLDFLQSIEPEKWPPLFGVFPTADMNGLFNPRKLLEIINTQVKTWDTPNFLVKRIMEEGKDGHQGWQSIQNLLHKGYNYQAACELMTLKTDRIPKSVINNGKAEDVFKHHEQAVRIHNALVMQFGEGDDKTLKTKAFPAEISRIWDKLRDMVGVKTATEHVLKFINQLTSGQVQEITNAKSKDDGGGTISKDEHRINLLKKAFEDFMAKNPIDSKE